MTNLRLPASGLRIWFECLFNASFVPKLGRRAPEIGRDDVREVYHGKYRVVYRVLRGGGIRVLSVFHGARRIRRIDTDA